MNTLKMNTFDFVKGFKFQTMGDGAMVAAEVQYTGTLHGDSVAVIKWIKPTKTIPVLKNASKWIGMHHGDWYIILPSHSNPWRLND